MFYKKKYQQAVEERDAWRGICFERDEKIRSLHFTIRKLKGMCDWLEKENEKLRIKEPFTFDKAEYQRLKLENAEIKKVLKEFNIVYANGAIERCEV